MSRKITPTVNTARPLSQAPSARKRRGTCCRPRTTAAPGSEEQAPITSGRTMVRVGVGEHLHRHSTAWRENRAASVSRRAGSPRRARRSAAEHGQGQDVPEGEVILGPVWCRDQVGSGPTEPALTLRAPEDVASTSTSCGRSTRRRGTAGRYGGRRRPRHRGRPGAAAGPSPPGVGAAPCRCGPRGPWPSGRRGRHSAATGPPQRAAGSDAVSEEHPAR
jgi:hypothetical protein